MTEVSALSRRALLIINPVSGKRAIIRFIPKIIRTLMDAGYLVTTTVTSRRDEARELAAALGGSFDLVCCTGGDGTLNEVVSGLADASLDVPLGYIPCGSTNDFAISRGLSPDIPTAAERAAKGICRRYDVGRFGDRYFSYVAAFGAFSWLSYTTDQNLKNALGHTAYLLDAIKDLYKIKPIRLQLEANGVHYDDEYIFGAICNSTSVAGTITLPEQIVNTRDGIFELLLIKMPKTIVDLDQIIRGLLSQDYSSPLIDFFQTRELDLICPPGLEWALDGEYVSTQDRVHVSVMPGFLQLKS